MTDVNETAGKDTITAGPGLDIVNAGDGDDTIVATIGDGSLDMYNDGAGTDTLNMSGITTPHHRQLGSLLRLEYSNRSGFYNLDRERSSPVLATTPSPAIASPTVSMVGPVATQSMPARATTS